MQKNAFVSLCDWWGFYFRLPSMVCTVMRFSFSHFNTFSYFTAQHCYFYLTPDDYASPLSANVSYRYACPPAQHLRDVASQVYTPTSGHVHVGVLVNVVSLQQCIKVGHGHDRVTLRFQVERQAIMICMHMSASTLNMSDKQPRWNDSPK